MAQNNISKLLQDFRTSITLPYYYKTKVLYNRVPDNILDASIIEGKMIIKYTMSGDRKKNSRGYYIYPEVRDLHIFTVEIDIAKSNVKKVDYINSVEITNDDGITISNSIKDEVFNETFLMDSFSLGTNSQALKDKLYNEISRSFNPYQPKIKKVNNSKSQSEKVVPKTISNKYIQ